MILFLIVVLLANACKQSIEPSAPQRICENLVAEGLIERERCFTADIQQTVYIPIYFPIGEVTVDYVSTGMDGFELLSFTQSNNCKSGEELIVAHYLTGTTDSVYFGFCNNVLVNVTYDD